MPERSQPLDHEGVSRSVRSKRWADEPDVANWLLSDRQESSAASADDCDSLKRGRADDLGVLPERKEPSENQPSLRRIAGRASCAPMGSGDANSIANGQQALGVAKTSAITNSARAFFKRGHALSYFGLFLFTADVYLRPYELLPQLSFLKTSAFWIALFTLLVYVPTQLGLEGKLTIKPREVKLVLLLLVAVLLSIPLALEPLRGWNSLLEYLKVVLMFIVMVNVVRTEKRLRWLIFFVLFASCVISVSALNDYLLGNLVLRGERIAGIIGGLFQNPNDLALHLVTMFPIAVVLTIEARNPLKKTMYLACAVLMIVGVVVTFSRGGFLGLACTGGILVWRIARHNRFLFGLAIPLVLLLFVALAPSGYGGRLSTASDESAVARQDDLKRSLFIAARHPLLGVGMDNYILYSNSNHATHNAYTQVAADLGLPAAVVYILFLITPLKELRRIGSETSESRRTSRFYCLAVGLEASLFGYMVSSFFASVAYLWYAYYLVAYAICLRLLYEKGQLAKLGLSEVSDGNKALDSTFDPPEYLPGECLRDA